MRNGTCDFFICYNHAAIPFNVDVDDYPRLVISRDRVLPYGNAAKFADILEPDNERPIPLLEYGPTSIMARVLRNVLSGAEFERRLRTVYRATLAESLATAAREGLGIAWLPESIAEHIRGDTALDPISHDYTAELEIMIFGSRHNKRPVVRRIWESLEAE